MRLKLFFAHGLTWVAALVLASSLVSAAPAKRAKGKAKRPPPVAADPPPPPETDKPSEKAEEAPTATPKPEDSALVQPDKPASAVEPAPSAADGAKAPVTGTAPIADSSATTEAEAALSAEHEALGRREAKRLTARRNEVAVSVSIDVGNRRFKYSDPIGNALRPYKLSIAPMASFGLEAYPLATIDVPVLRDLGFRGRFSRAFGLDSTTPEGDKIETSWTRFGGDVRERLLIPGRHPLEFGAFFGADASYFVMSSKSNVMALLPSARTIALRFGLDGRVLIAGRCSAELGFAYLAVTSPGEIYEHFRDPQVAGIDGDLGFTVAVVPGLEARLVGRYTRYFASFHPQLGDPYVAGGALDEQLQVGLGVRYAH